MLPSSTISCLAAFLLLGFGHANCNPTKPVISCDDIPEPVVPGVEVLSVTTELRPNWSGLVWDPENGNFTTSNPLSVCTVNVTLIHPGASHEVTVWVWLPVNRWNGRFQGVGGGGWSAGSYSLSDLGVSALQGYAAASTDGSNIIRDDGLDRDLILGPGELDLQRVADFSYRGLHLLAVVGKAVTASFYGDDMFYSYWNGCSQGGRQGFQLAQRYPEDFDGILANAPALYWPNMVFSLAWGRHVLRVLDYTPSFCVIDEFRKASIAACDSLDGVEDGIVSDVAACDFDPAGLVGRNVDCGILGGGTRTITAKDAQVAAMIRAGPHSARGTRLWEGFEWGTSSFGLLPGSIVGVPPAIDMLTEVFIKYFLEKNADFDMSTLTTVDQFTDYFALAYAEWGGLMGTDDPDLFNFKEAGGKLLSWHGTTDELIPVNNTIRYRTTVEGVMGGNDAVNEFFKFYVAPGAGHCAGGDGAVPQDAMKKLEAWVETGIEPDVLEGTMTTPDGEKAERIICPFPLVAKYDGSSDSNSASSYTCSEDY